MIYFAVLQWVKGVNLVVTLFGNASQDAVVLLKTAQIGTVRIEFALVCHALVAVFGHRVSLVGVLWKCELDA